MRSSTAAASGFDWIHRDDGGDRRSSAGDLVVNNFASDASWNNWASSPGRSASGRGTRRTAAGRQLAYANLGVPRPGRLLPRHLPRPPAESSPTREIPRGLRELDRAREAGMSGIPPGRSGARTTGSSSSTLSGSSPTHTSQWGSPHGPRWWAGSMRLAAAHGATAWWCEVRRGPADGRVMGALLPRVAVRAGPRREPALCRGPRTR